MLALLGCAALLVDVPLAMALAAHRLPRLLGQMVKFSEIAGHGTGAAMLLVAALVLAGINLRRLQDRLLTLRLAGATYLGGLIVDGFKLLVPRVRPQAALLSGPISALDTFGRELLRPELHSRAALMSFPSGHAAVAAGLAATLSWMVPKGRPVFASFAVLACLQRLVSGSHYLSDVCFGAALGLLGAWLCLPRSAQPGDALIPPALQQP